MNYVLHNLHYFVLLIGALVFFHELGHFLVAKAFDVKVIRFSLGFGPRLFGFTKGETEYLVSLLPLGGYVKMLGEMPSSEVPPEDQERSFSAKPVWQRSMIAFAGPVFNFVLALFVYFGLFLGPQQIADTRLGYVSYGGPAWQAGLRPGDRIVNIEGEATESWGDITEGIGSRPRKTIRLAYERKGERAEIAVSTEAMQQDNVFREEETRGRIGISLLYLKPTLAVVDRESPAAAVRLQTGDVIEKVNGESVEAWHEVRQGIAATPIGEAIDLVLKRGEATVHVQVLPEAGAGPQGLPAGLFSSADAPWGYTGLVNQDSIIAEVKAETPAAEAGLQKGDRLLAITIHRVDGAEQTQPIGIWELDLPVFQREDPRSDVVITYQRDQEVVQRPLKVVRKQEEDDFKNVRTVPVFGATNDSSTQGTYTVERVFGAVDAIKEAALQVSDDLTLIGKGIAKLISGSIPFDSMGGPIMLFVIAEKSAKQGWSSFLRMLALISVNLGLINLIPIPALDGGHLMFFAFEAVRRRPPSLRVRELANLVGVALLIILMILVIRNDILRHVLD